MDSMTLLPFSSSSSSSSSPSLSISLSLEREKMRRKMMTSLVALVLTLVVVFVSSSYNYCHSRDLLSYSETLTLALNSTAPQALHEASNHALAELPRDPRRRRRSVPHEAVLLPDWEALVLLPSGANGGGGEEVSCLFSNGAASPARFAGSVPSSGRAAYSCVLPGGVRRLRPFRSPRLVLPGGDGAGEEPSPEMLRWNRLAYESLSTPDDVVVFAKGVNTRSAAAEVRCVYYSAHGAAAAASSSAAISAAQEVFRCPHPPPSLEIGAELRVSLATGAADATPIPSLASYRPAAAHGSAAAPRSLICGCTMVYNAGKFLGEWVAYHAAIGVERFFLYDNASDDEEALAAAIRRLSSAGHRVSSRYWPWPKTQEAAFSHCAAAHRDACRWMAFVDVDEFVFSPDWAGSSRPNRSMLGSLLPVRPNIGQVTVGCYEFGPSGLSAHPKPGVTQGYTCRRRAAERHKSVVRLDAVDRSLANSVHHFSLRKGFRTRRVGTVRVNHYKYQAWDEFKVKFRRRASAFVADWSTAVNPGSRDRTPGLGFKAIEPVGWAEMFCEVRDFRLRDATRRWFGAAGPHGTYKMVWE